MWRRAAFISTVVLAGMGWLLSAAAVAAVPSVLLGGPTAGPAKPNAVAVSGPDLPDVLIVRAAERPDRFQALLSEVDWLAKRAGNAPQPDPAGLGPRYQIVVLIDDVPDQRYDIYPLAVGGPRVFRPAEQPRREVAAAWFYGRVSMPETLHDAGVPPLTTTGGAGGEGGGEGGGEALPAPDGVERAGVGAGAIAAGGDERRVGAAGATPEPAASIEEIVRRWQRDTLLVLGGALLLLLALGYVSLLSRRG